VPSYFSIAISIEKRLAALFQRLVGSDTIHGAEPVAAE